MYLTKRVSIRGQIPVKEYHPHTSVICGLNRSTVSNAFSELSETAAIGKFEFETAHIILIKRLMLSPSYVYE